MDLTGWSSTWPGAPRPGSRKCSDERLRLGQHPTRQSNGRTWVVVLDVRRLRCNPGAGDRTVTDLNVDDIQRRYDSVGLTIRDGPMRDPNVSAGSGHQSDDRTAADSRAAAPLHECVRDLLAPDQQTRRLGCRLTRWRAAGIGIWVCEPCSSRRDSPPFTATTTDTAEE